MAVRWELAATNPVHGTERLPEDNEHPSPLTVEEETRLQAVLPPQYLPIVTLAL
jgi:hypothetical protein